MEKPHVGKLLARDVARRAGMLHDAGSLQRRRALSPAGFHLFHFFKVFFALQPTFLLLYAALEAVSPENISPHAFSSPSRSLPWPPHPKLQLQRSSQWSRSKLKKPIWVKLKPLEEEKKWFKSWSVSQDGSKETEKGKSSHGWRRWDHLSDRGCGWCSFKLT